MLKPSGGFRKLFSPERMAKMRKPSADTAVSRPAAPPQRANRERQGGGVIGRAVGRGAY